MRNHGRPELPPSQVMTSICLLYQIEAASFALPRAAGAFAFGVAGALGVARTALLRGAGALLPARGPTARVLAAFLPTFTGAFFEAFFIVGLAGADFAIDAGARPALCRVRFMGL